MDEHQASRTLVKSPPELWMACSDQESLARHLSSFGEIRITRLDPETAVAWEGDAACGTVRIEPSGWGTKVTLTARRIAQTTGGEPAAPPPHRRAETDLERCSEPPVPEVKPTTPDPPAERPSFWQRLFGRGRAPEAAVRLPAPGATGPVRSIEAGPGCAAEPTQPGPDPLTALSLALDPMAALGAALDSLGQAHHRPFSRSSDAKDARGADQRASGAVGG